MNGQASVLAVDAFEGEAYAALLAEAQSILDSELSDKRRVPRSRPKPNARAADPSPTPGALPNTAVAVPASAPPSSALLVLTLTGLATLVVARRVAVKR